MSLITKTYRGCLPFLVMLVSASVTDSLVQTNNVPSAQVSQVSTPHIEPAADRETYFPRRSTDINMPPDNLPEIDETTDDSVSVTDIWTRIRNGFVFPAVEPDMVRTEIDEYIKVRQ